MPPKPASKKPAQAVQVIPVNESTNSLAARLSEVEERLAKLEQAVRAGLGLNF